MSRHAHVRPSSARPSSRRGIRILIGLCAATLLTLSTTAALAGTLGPGKGAERAGAAGNGPATWATPADRAARAADSRGGRSSHHSRTAPSTNARPAGTPAKAPTGATSPNASVATESPVTPAPAPATPEPVAAGTSEAATPDRAPVNAEPSTTAPPATAAAAGVTAMPSWDAAWGTADAGTLRAWFAANTGPSKSVSGTVGGGNIRTQADADRLAGHVVTSALTVSCSCVLQDFVLQNAPLSVDSGKVSIRNARLDGRGNTDMVGVLTARGSAELTLSRVDITGHNDGIRAYARSVHGEYVFIHDRATSNPLDHHQDGIQTIGGATDFQRSFVDMIGANTSATLIKPDASPIPYANINNSVMMGGGYTFHVHDGPQGVPAKVDLSGNLVAPGYGSGLVSTWQLTNPDRVIPPTTARVSGTDRTVRLVDGARI